MTDTKVEKIRVVQSPGPNGAVILEPVKTVEIIPADPAPRGQYL